jgi:hypothetical protein
MSLQWQTTADDGTEVTLKSIGLCEIRPIQWSVANMSLVENGQLQETFSELNELRNPITASNHGSRSRDPVCEALRNRDAVYE